MEHVKPTDSRQRCERPQLQCAFAEAEFGRLQTWRGLSSGQVQVAVRRLSFRGLGEVLERPRLEGITIGAPNPTSAAGVGRADRVLSLPAHSSLPPAADGRGPFARNAQYRRDHRCLLRTGGPAPSRGLALLAGLDASRASASTTTSSGVPANHAGAKPRSLSGQYRADAPTRRRADAGRERRSWRA